MHWAIRFLATVLPITYGLAGMAYVLVFFRDDPEWKPCAAALHGSVTTRWRVVSPRAC